MICNACNKNQATVHLTEIVNNQMMELHLCEICAQEKTDDFKNQLSFNDILAGLADFTTQLDEKKETLMCPSCGLTYEGFRKSGRLGCAQCYASFARRLQSLIKRVQGGTQHVGKVPTGAPEVTRSRMELRSLQDELNRLIQSEEFEKAAKVRDQIKKMEMKEKETKEKKKK
jgi:protein arginine kinase activator